MTNPYGNNKKSAMSHEELIDTIRLFQQTEPRQKKPIGLPEPRTRLGKLIKKLYGCLGGYIIILAVLHVLLWQLVPFTQGASFIVTGLILAILYRYSNLMNHPIWRLIEAPWYTGRDPKAGALIGIVLPMAILMLIGEGAMFCVWYAVMP
ncbi:MAG: hypothetical protein GY833_22870 [Aestuariibacter sp.]|nr:hypothetical protein [Aestuariibacter sp.]|tara:strand:+ start:197480 stop:197929 length:450 start_codon:yes stop_codon:yes gene_type:complete